LGGIIIAELLRGILLYRFLGELGMTGSVKICRMGNPFGRLRACLLAMLLIFR
jgi:hypothetical protein